MPFQPPNFAGIPLQEGFKIPDIVELFRQGQQARREPAQMRQAFEEKELANALNRMKMERYPEQERIEEAFKQAQTQKLQREANSPFGGRQIPGDVGQAVELDNIRQQYGEDSAVYKNAERAYENTQKSKEFLNQYRNILGKLSNKRFSSPLGKKFQEYSDVEAGLMPGTEEQINNPEKQQEMLNQISQSIQKDVTDRQVRQRVEFATNIDKTLDSLNVDDLVQYGGIKGQAKLKADQAQSALGSAPESYLKYTKAANAAVLLRKQVRQFYGDSITPTMDERLQKLTEPATWINNPEVAKGEFESFRKILKNETGTFKSAMESTDIYKNKKTSSKMMTGTIVDKEGKTKQVSVSPQNRAAFEKAGGKINE